MCGRTCLALDPSELRNACKYRKVELDSRVDTLEKSAKNTNIENNVTIPEWRKEYNCGLEYKPSFNIAPQSITPVLVSSDHFDERNGASETKYERLIVPMFWGIIPFWHKGDYKKHGLTTNNCRLEHMLESKLYKKPFLNGQRCVIVCEAFYEWQTTLSSKPSTRDPYLIYMPQDENVSIWNRATWTSDNIKLLKIAGLFDVWTDDQGDKIYSYSVITFESNKTMNWLHHRMPAILETEQQVDDWLDFKRVSSTEALKTIRPVDILKWHRVSKVVNNSRNDEADCTKPIEVLDQIKNSNTKSLKAWLQIRKRREEELQINYDSESDECSSEKDTVSPSTIKDSDNENNNSNSKRQCLKNLAKVRKQS